MRAAVRISIPAAKSKSSTSQKHSACSERSNWLESEMAKLTAAKRKAEPKSDFGLPGERKYPMPDKSHAANAKARASQAVKAGRMSPSTEAKIDAKANKKLGKRK
jgi:hypothetical protein